MSQLSFKCSLWFLTSFIKCSSLHFVKFFQQFLVFFSPFQTYKRKKKSASGCNFNFIYCMKMYAELNSDTLYSLQLHCVSWRPAGMGLQEWSWTWASQPMGFPSWCTTKLWTAPPTDQDRLAKCALPNSGDWMRPYTTGWSTSERHCSPRLEISVLQYVCSVTDASLISLSN